MPIRKCQFGTHKQKANKANGKLVVRNSKFESKKIYKLPPAPFLPRLLRKASRVALLLVLFLLEAPRRAVCVLCSTAALSTSLWSPPWRLGALRLLQKRKRASELATIQESRIKNQELTYSSSQSLQLQYWLQSWHWTPVYCMSACTKTRRTQYHTVSMHAPPLRKTSDC